MKVGFGSAELAVPVGTAMGGYAFREGSARGRLDGLEVSAVTWHDGRRRMALVLADLVCVNTDLVAAARARLSDVDVAWLAASHTHAGPETGCVPGGAETPAPWRDTVAGLAATAVRRAVESETPALGVLRTGVVREVGAVRSQAPADSLVPMDVIEVRNPAGVRLGVLAVLPVHPTVLPAGNLLVSADLTGAVRRALRERLGPGTWVAVVTGAAGDISTRHTRRGDGPEELARLGSVVADRCCALLGEPGQSAWSAGDRIAWRSRVAQLAAKSTHADGGTLVSAASAALAAARAGDDAAAVRIAAGNLDGARLVAALPPPTEHFGAEVGACRIGTLGLVALPGEPFLALAESVRSRRDGPTVVFGYANGYPGYLPTRESYGDGQDRYEVLAAAVEAGSGELIADLATALLSELDGGPQ